MSNVARVLGAGGNTQSIPSNVEDVFSTLLYDGSGSAQTINNGIDLSGEGGLVWIKKRDASKDHGLMDTEQGLDGSSNSRYLKSNSTSAQSTGSLITAYNSNGFTTGTADMTNGSGEEYVSWTFRKAPKFFDIVTYTGNATNRTIAHNLGSAPGMILIKDLTGTGAWAVYHRSVGNGAGQNYVLTLNTTAGDASGVWNGTAPTSSVFSVGTDGTVNESGRNFVAYLFAHNNSDGVFGATGDKDIIKCGHFETNSSEEATIDLGFEPQWIFYKRYNSSTEGDWLMYDNMRGMQGDFVSNASLLEANTADAEAETTNRIAITSTGFKVDNWGTSSSPFIYVAIRRGPMATPTAGTEVFATVNQAGGYQTTRYATSGFPVDFALGKETSQSGSWYAYDRMRGSKLDLNTNDDSVENSNSPGPVQFDFMDKVRVQLFNSSTTVSWWMWKRAPSYFDVVAYTGTGSARTVSHNLGAVPEMMWVKPRETGSASSDWWVFNKDLSTPADDSLVLNSTGASNTGNGALLWNSTMPTSSVFSLGTYNGINQSGRDFIAYLFATLAGVSKVGSYTGNGNTSGPTVDCGFTSGPKFVLIKRTGNTGSWYLFDSVRGIVAGAESQLYLNSNAAEQTATDQIDPTSSGFQIVTNATGLNSNGDNYIFYAIA